VNDKRWRSVMAALGPVQPRTAPVVESRVSSPVRITSNSTSPEIIFEADAIATR
jgi:hypothetical protein